MRKLIAIGTTAALLALTGSAQAGEYVYKTVTTYETVYDVVTKEVPYTAYVTKYDHCGKPYEVAVTRYKEVDVKVARKIPVTKKVKVPVYGHAY